MEEQTKSFRPVQEMQQTNPVEQIRQPTDRVFILIFAIFMLLWMGVGIAALWATPGREHSQELAEIKVYINAPFSSLGFGHIIAFVISLVLSAGSILFALFLKKKCTKFFVYLGIGLYILSTISVCFNVLFGFIMASSAQERSDISFRSLRAVAVYLESVSRGWILVKAIFMITSVISFFKVDQEEMRNVVRDFCRVILASPLMILFASFVTILGCLIFLFSANAIFNDVYSDRQVYHILIDVTIIILGFICALSFIYNFALMVISQYTVNYYWNKGGKPGVGQTVSQMLKYHIGTIMFSCIPCVPFICAVVQAVKHTRSPRNKESYFFYLASKVFLLLNAEYFALTVSSIFGSGFVKSLKKTFDIVLRRCLFYLAISGVIEAVIGIIAVIVVILTVIALAVTTALAVSNIQTAETRDASQINLDTVMYMASFMYGFMIPLVTFAIFMYFAAKALLINRIIILNKEEQYNEGKTEILNRL